MCGLMPRNVHAQQLVLLYIETLLKSHRFRAARLTLYVRVAGLLRRDQKGCWGWKRLRNAALRCLELNVVFASSGECSDCMFNTGGKYCERCADGYYGDAIGYKNCKECSCDSCGTEVCDHSMGHCSCRPNVVGALCDSCKPGTNPESLLEL